MTAMFQSGDLVLHSAGGPRMTVEFYREKPEQPVQSMPVQPAGVFCVWFDRNNILHRDRFDQRHITKIEAE